MKRRSLFGLIAGAFAAKVVPAPPSPVLGGSLPFYDLRAPALNLYPRTAGYISKAGMLERGVLGFEAKITDDTVWAAIKDGGMKNFSMGYDPRAVRTASPTEEEVVIGEVAMFTIKAMGEDGAYVVSCAAYNYRQGTYHDDNSVETICRLELCDAEHKISGVLAVGDDTIYVMNAAGATIDKYEQMTPDHPMRKAVQRTPETFRKKYWPTVELVNDLNAPAIHGVNTSVAPTGSTDRLA